MSCRGTCANDAFWQKIFYSIMFGFIVTKDDVCLMDPPDIMLPVSMTAFKTVM